MTFSLPIPSVAQQIVQVRRSVVLFLLFFSLLSLSAQTNILLGPRLGANGSSFVWPAFILETGSLDRGPGIEMVGAGVLEIAFPKLISIQTEIGFLSKTDIRQLTSVISDGDSGVAAVTIEDWRMILRFVEIPILAKLRFGNEKVQGYVLAGPAIGIGTKAKRMVTGRLFDASGDFSDYEHEFFPDYKEDLYRIEYSLQAGIGIQWPIGKERAFLDLRYTHGLNNLLRETSLSSDLLKTRTVAFTLGYMFSLGGKDSD